MTFSHRAVVAVASVGALWGMAKPRPTPAPLTLESTPSRYAQVDGMKVHYKALGKGGAPIVFVHGWACDMTSWAKQVPVFAKNGQVLALDLPGHGGSDKPEIVYSMDLFARSVAAVMDHAGVQKAVVVGHSMGTPVARQFYRLYPKRTLAIAAVEGALKPFLTDPAAVERFLAPYRGTEFRQAQAEFIDAMFAQGTPDTADRDAVKAVALSTPQHVLVSAGQAMFDPAIWKDDPILVPLLCVYAKSPSWSDEYKAYVKKLAPRLDFRVWDEVGHFLMLQVPDQFDELLALFVAHPPTG